jgi:hypothetical protein
MVRMGLVLADDYVAMAFAEKARVIKHFHSASSADPFRSMDSCLSQVEDEIRILRRRISSVSIVTDATRTALIDSGKLDKVTLLRLSSPEGRDSPTLLDRNLANRILSSLFVISGGHGFDGRVIGPPDSNEIEECYSRATRSANAFVVSSPFSILYPDHEQMGVTVLSRLGAKGVWSSTDVSSQTSMLDRETTALLSACTSNIIERLATAALSKLDKLGCRPRIYFGCNDGTVAGVELAKRFPLSTAWSVESHSAAGASRSERVLDCLVTGTSGGETWLTGVRKGTPISRTISYIGDMLVHVFSPVLARFSESTPREVKRSRFELMSQLVGAKKTFAGDVTVDWDAPFTVTNTKKSAEYAAINAACASIDLKWTRSLPMGTDLKSAEKNLRGILSSQMKKAAAKSYSFSHQVHRPGINLPEGTTTLSLEAHGTPV